MRGENRTWRVIYRLDADAVVIVEVFGKTTQAIPKQVIAASQKRLREYEKVVRGEG